VNRNEKNLSTKAARSKNRARIFKTDENPSRAQSVEAPAEQRPQTVKRLMKSISKQNDFKLVYQKGRIIQAPRMTLHFFLVI